MLEILRIRDLALIEDMEMEFSEGLNVLTGETGAGKSFIMRALNFLAGDSLSPDIVRPGKEKAVVEALFVLEGQDLLLRRELAAESGRSRGYLNDRLCSQEALKDLRPALILHASQHGQQRLLQPSFQAKILDDFMNRPDLLEKKNSLLRALAELQERKKKLELTLADLAGKRDLLEYQQQEIEKVSPQPDEEESLENRRTALRNQAALSGHLTAALAALHGGEAGEAGLLKQFAALERALAALSALRDEFAGLPESLSETRLALQDLDARLRRSANDNPSDLDIEAIEARLYALAQLKRKLKRPLSAIISLGREIGETLSFLDSSHLEQKKLLAEEKELGDALAALLAVLNPARETAAAAFSSAIQDELKKLDFSEHIRVFFTFAPHLLVPGREDCQELRCRLLWQPNPGQNPQPLDKIASGGELSRFLLAVISLMSRAGSENPTLIFDEVDAGVGGLTLNRLAESLSDLSLTRQTLLITHWPQLAGKARRHFTVRKEVLNGMTYTRCRLLQGEAIGKELLRMTGQE
ncbi:MAG: AAA family ATPase [Deltaproteobacteria bacterium]|nr:AAA family ATPase [Deltaproteobacteria bacterium]